MGFPLSMNLGLALDGRDGVSSRCGFQVMQDSVNALVARTPGVLQNGKFASQPDALQIQGPGSTGDVSGMSVTLPNGAVATLPSAFIPASTQLPTCVLGSATAPVPSGQPFLCSGFILIAQ
jgi:hypothetical protein